MGQTNPNYPVREIAIAVEDCAAHTFATKERKLAGDIIACRRPAYIVGTGEVAVYLWLRVEGLEENEMARLTDMLVEGGVRFDKRRYCIPLARLAEVAPGFSVARALDPADKYQPFLTFDTESHLWLTAAPPFDVRGLVFDKQTGAFL